MKPQESRQSGQPYTTCRCMKKSPDYEYLNWYRWCIGCIRRSLIQLGWHGHFPEEGLETEGWRSEGVAAVSRVPLVQEDLQRLTIQKFIVFAHKRIIVRSRNVFCSFWLCFVRVCSRKWEGVQLELEFLKVLYCYENCYCYEKLLVVVEWWD